MTTQTIDEAKLNAFIGKAVGDFGATLNTAMVVIGDKLGLYRALARGPLTEAALAARTDTLPRYLHPWLVNQAAGGYLEYDPATETYTLPAEHALALADESSPAYVIGGFQMISGALRATPRVAEAFRAGGGVAWSEQDADLFEGVERFFRPGYRANLVQSWIPALDGVAAKLEAGASVADVGCGHGASTIIMAQAYPNSHFIGFDNHPASIEQARQAASEAGLGDRVRFAVADAAAFPGGDYDLICFFDCLHDMGDPWAAARHAHRMVADDGTLLIVEPMAGNTVAANLNPVGRIYAGASVLICTANAMATGGLGLGTIATDDELCAVLTAGGFTHFRRATETPLNRIFEARP